MAASLKTGDNKMREPTSVPEAVAVLDEILAGHGNPPRDVSEDLQNLRDRSQAYVDRMSQSLREEKEKLIRFTVSAIYSTPSRYLYELVQNADDVSYSSPEEPGLTFTLDAEHLIIDTNEDGFKAANVKALCAVNESSKKIAADDDSIGEKGIGFKSVFNVAKDVRIQSGFWSFHFENHRQRPLSIVSPLSVDHQELPQGVTTRIKLRYHEGYTHRIARDLEGLSHNTLMFLRKVAVFRIVFRDITIDGSTPADREFKKERTAFSSPRREIVTLKTQQGSDFANLVEKKRYRLFKQKFSGMPEDERRQVLSAEVQLGLPVNVFNLTACPREVGENIFAFLPVSQQRSIPFVIQSDFITTNSREDIVSCEWNDQLRTNVGKLFVTAMKALVAEGCVHEWLEYLPVDAIDGFWSHLPLNIFKSLKSEPILQPWSGGLSTPSKLVMLRKCFLHDEAPLFDDTLSETIYLSPSYLRKGFKRKLQDLGMRKITWSEMLYRAESDCTKSSSRLKAIPWSESWHTTFATFIERVLEDAADSGTASLTNRIHRMTIIPLRDDTWATPSETIYFPYVDEQEIPTNLGLKLVHPGALKTGDRSSLYERLGVSDCTIDVVRKKILDWHLSGMSRKTMNRETMLLHLRFLHYDGTINKQMDRDRLWAVSSGNVMRPFRDGLYFPSDGEHNAQALLAIVEQNKSVHDSFETDLVLHTDFIRAKHTEAYHKGYTWEHWLERVFSVRHYPPLLGRQVSGTSKMSSILSRVLDADSVLFLGTLQTHWLSSYSKEAQQSARSAQLIGARTVLCTNGERWALHFSYFPGGELVSLAETLHIRSYMPFVMLPRPDARVNDWDFLTRFGVRFDADMKFWLLALGCLRRREDLSTEKKLNAAFKVYERVASMANKDTHTEIKAKFEQEKGICNPKNGTDWRVPAECLWKSPDFISTRVTLERYYGGSDGIRMLFVDILGVRNADSLDIIKELEHLKQNKHRKDVAVTAAKVYEALDVYDYKEAEEQCMLRDHFERKLILVDGEWLKPSDCVWDFAVTDLGKPRLRQKYSSLQTFFVHKVGVPTVDAAWLLKELKSLSQNTTPDIGKLTAVMQQLGNMIAANDVGDMSVFDKQFKQLEQSKYKFLPTRVNGQHQVLRCVNDQFFINDHAVYASKFSKQVEVLDFDMDTSHKLHWFFQKLGLEGRYLSARVKVVSEPETSTLNEAMTEDFRKRAYAFSCCAAKYRSRQFIDDPATYKHMLQAEILLSDDLRTELRLELAGDEYVAEKADHVGPKVAGLQSGNIAFYFPASPSDLGRSLRASFPTLLRDVLGVKDNAADHWLYQLWKAELGDVYGILEEAQAPFLSWIEKIELKEDERLMPTADIQDQGSMFESRQDASTLNLATETALQNHPEQQNALSGPSLTIEHSNLSRPFELRLGADRDVRAMHIAEYHRLLRRLLYAVRGVSYSIPTPDKEATLSRALVFGDVVDADDVTFKIGAAGELFVYETLRNLQLPLFGLDNWQSSIRDRVSVLSEYEGLTSWFGSDMDIVVDDCSGQLEGWLRQHSYVDFPALPLDPNSLFKNVRFIFEVKATTGDCSDRLYMSHNQYKEMHRHKLTLSPWTGTVFVLARVYRLLDAKPQLKLFVDPARLEGTVLNFTAEKWHVKARA